MSIPSSPYGWPNTLPLGTASGQHHDQVIPETLVNTNKENVAAMPISRFRLETPTEVLRSQVDAVSEFSNSIETKDVRLEYVVRNIVDLDSLYKETLAGLSSERFVFSEKTNNVVKVFIKNPGTNPFVIAVVVVDIIPEENGANGIYIGGVVNVLYADKFIKHVNDAFLSAVPETEPTDVNFSIPLINTDSEDFISRVIFLLNNEDSFINYLRRVPLANRFYIIKKEKFKLLAPDICSNKEIGYIDFNLIQYKGVNALGDYTISGRCSSEDHQAVVASLCARLEEYLPKRTATPENLAKEDEIVSGVDLSETSPRAEEYLKVGVVVRGGGNSQPSIYWYNEPLPIGTVIYAKK